MSSSIGGHCGPALEQGAQHAGCGHPADFLDLQAAVQHQGDIGIQRAALGQLEDALQQIGRQRLAGVLLRQPQRVEQFRQAAIAQGALRIQGAPEGIVQYLWHLGIAHAGWLIFQQFEVGMGAQLLHRLGVGLHAGQQPIDHRGQAVLIAAPTDIGTKGIFRRAVLGEADLTRQRTGAGPAQRQRRQQQMA